MAKVNRFQHVIDSLDAGAAVVIPTDTVYGLAARPEIPGAVDAIFTIKRRADDQPLPVLAADIDALRDVVELDRRAEELAAEYWPGPLTLVLPRSQRFPYDLGNDRSPTVAVRIPALHATLELLAATGRLAVTSANRSGAPPAVSVDEARSALGDEVEVFVDGGRVGGAPSTVFDLSGDPKVLREGALSEQELMARLGRTGR